MGRWFFTIILNITFLQILILNIKLCRIFIWNRIFLIKWSLLPCVQLFHFFYILYLRSLNNIILINKFIIINLCLKYIMIRRFLLSLTLFSFRRLLLRLLIFYTNFFFLTIIFILNLEILLFICIRNINRAWKTDLNILRLVILLIWRQHLHIYYRIFRIYCKFFHVLLSFFLNFRVYSEFLFGFV